MLQFLGNGSIDLNIAKTALNKLEIDELGLDEIDRKILETMIIKYQGKPIGIEALATTSWRRHRYTRRCI